MFRTILMMIMMITITGCNKPEPGSNAGTESNAGSESKTEAGAPPEHSNTSGTFGRGNQNAEEKLASMMQDAEAGDAKSQVGLARKYYNGDEVPQDYAKAAELYEKAAEQGFAMAQYNIGMMYQKGEGVTQDAAKAEKWLNKAAAQGLK